MIDLIVALEMEIADIQLPAGVRLSCCGVGTVSYTHLTLPTTPYV